MTTAFYSLATGLIGSTLTSPFTDAAQIAALAAQGTGVATIPDGKDGSTGMIDLATGRYVDVTPAPPVPSLNTQLTVALINSGVIPASGFHAGTLADMNAAMTAAGLAGVKTPA